MANLLAADIPPGARITHLETVTSNPNLTRIRVDGRVVARLRTDEVAELHLAVGDEWTDACARSVMHCLAMAKARKTALNILSRRGYSRAELASRLIRKGHEREVAFSVADEMVADGWIDEAEYARSVARSALAGKPAGHRLIVQKLRARKLDRELAERIAAEMLEDVDLTDAAIDLAQRRLRTMGNLPETTARRRIAALLTRRGFDGDTVRTAMDRIQVINEESATDFSDGET